MNSEKTKNIILTAAGLLCALLTFLALIYCNNLYFWLGDYAIIGFIVFPVLALGIIIYASMLIFKKQKIGYVIPVAVALIGCLLAFILSNEASLSKIEGDFLKHENEFNRIVKTAEVAEGTFDIDSKELKGVVPEQKLQTVHIGNGNFAYFLIAVDVSDRYEGYVYIPYGTPEDWDSYGFFSEPLDLDKHWFYMSLIK